MLCPGQDVGSGWRVGSKQGGRESMVVVVVVVHSRWRVGRELKAMAGCYSDSGGTERESHARP